MERRRLGGTGVDVTRLVLGCGNFGGIGSAPELFGQGESDEAAFAIMDAAWALGIRAFDTADAYGGGRSESAVGAWLRLTGNRPTLTTKTFNPMEAGADRGLGRERIVRQIESSLERLGVDSVDLYLAHEFDPDTPLSETIETFDGLVGVGLIAGWGVSNFNAQQLRELLKAGGRPAVLQNSYSLLDRRDEREIAGLCAEFDIAYEAYSPLAGGWLTGKYRRGEEPPSGSRMTQRPGPYERFRTDAVFHGLEQLEERARLRGIEITTLALAWVLAQPHVTAIVVGPRRAEHLGPSITALSVHLSPDESAELASLLPG
jgi:aryl-alcohol dehydrogenase-like predicted oxidoreductase